MLLRCDEVSDDVQVLPREVLVDEQIFHAATLGWRLERGGPSVLSGIAVAPLAGRAAGFAGARLVRACLRVPRGAGSPPRRWIVT